MTPSGSAKFPASSPTDRQSRLSNNLAIGSSAPPGRISIILDSPSLLLDLRGVTWNGSSMDGKGSLESLCSLS